MTAAVSTIPDLVSLEEYLSTSYEPDCDYVDGRLEERNVGEREHSILQVALGAWFFNHRREWKIIAMSEQRTRVSSGRVRLPDLCLVSTDAPAERVTITPPILAVEFLSAEDRMNRVFVRLKDFLDMGVQNVWLIDPIERVAYTFDRSGLKLMEVDRIEIANTPIYVELAELFSALD